METKKKWKCYQVHRDEEDGSWWREFRGYVHAENAQEAERLGKEKFGHVLGEPFRVFLPGVRVKKRGYLSERERNRVARERFDDMCDAEKEAYLGL